MTEGDALEYLNKYSTPLNRRIEALGILINAQDNTLKHMRKYALRYNYEILTGTKMQDHKYFRHTTREDLARLLIQWYKEKIDGNL